MATLLSHWPLNDSPLQTTLDDIGTANQDMTLQYGWALGGAGYDDQPCARLDSGTIVFAPYPGTAYATAKDSGSMALWVKADIATTAQEFGLFEVNTASPKSRCKIHTANTNQIECICDLGGTARVTWAPERVPKVDEWLHLAATWDVGGTDLLTFYVNGYQVGSVATSTAATDVDDLVWGQGVTGAMQNLKFWSGVLTDAEVLNEVETALPSKPWQYVIPKAEIRALQRDAEQGLPERCAIQKYASVQWLNIHEDVPCKIESGGVHSELNTSDVMVDYEKWLISVSGRWALPTFPFKVARFVTGYGMTLESIGLNYDETRIVTVIECKRI